MGMFDTINAQQAAATGQSSFVQEAKWFAALDLNSIFKEGGKALTSWIGNAIEFFHYLFSSPGDQEKILGERLIDQIPGMAVALSQAGYLDSTVGAYASSHPTQVNIVDRHYGHYDPIIKVAQILFTALFGVRILNGFYLDFLENGTYRTLPYTSDIPDVALQRAEFLKKNFFQNSTYNNVRWDINKFQEYPLKAPIPSLDFGKLYTGSLPGGGNVVDGYLASGGTVVTEQEAGAFTTTTAMSGDGLNTGIIVAILAIAAVIAFSE